MNELRDLPINELHSSPFQARTTLNEEVIAGARVALVGGSYPAEMAVTARCRAAGGWEVLSGQHRVEAARREGLRVVLAVVLVLSDAEAALHVVAANNQSEISNLDHGRHQFLLKKLFGIDGAMYARAVGKTHSWAHHCRCAVEMIDESGNDPTIAALPLLALVAIRPIEGKERRQELLAALARMDRPAEAARVVRECIKNGDSVAVALKKARRAGPRRVELIQGDEQENNTTHHRPDLAAYALRSDYLSDCIEGLARMLEVRMQMEARLKPDMSNPVRAKAFVDAVYTRLRTEASARPVGARAQAG